MIRRTFVACFLLTAMLAWPQAPKKKGGKQAGDDTSNPAYKSAPVSTDADPSGKPAKPAGFVHPGVLVNRAQLDEIKKRVAAGTEPQKAAFAALKGDKLGELDYTPHPRATVECGPRSNPDIGCKDEQADSEAAYAQALLWYATADAAYARNAVKIMNAWADTLTGGHTNANAEVQASWAGAVWPRAAEIIRYSYQGWSDAEIARFQNMLTTQYLPSLIHGTCENGNKEMTMSEAIVNIGVFNDNRAAFDFGIKMWRGRAPAVIYLKSDGAQPVEAVGCGQAIWGNKGLTPEFVDGLLQARGHGVCRHGGCSRDGPPARDRFVRRAREARHGRHGIPGAISSPESRQAPRESGIQSAPHLGNRLQPFPRPPGNQITEDGRGHRRESAHRRKPPHELGNPDPRGHGLAWFTSFDSVTPAVLPPVAFVS
ncbi:exported hypothetical protein [Candidatus Sulfopaludibacter sp. SbA3]|nr:exported hypothetical protein [Candidatus Sulfopaludibacter sp. SbA3]